MTQRTISEKNRAWLSEEMKIWQSQGILTDEHSAKIWDVYVTVQESARRRYALARFALFSLAALMVGLAVFLVIGYNWKAIGRSVKLTIIFGAILGVYGMGYWLRYLYQSRILSEVLLFLGCLFYGAAIWLIAQIFNINGHYPDGLWYWAMGVLPFAICLDTLLFHLLYAGLLAIWAGSETLGFAHLGHWLFFGWSVPMPVAYSLPLMALPGIVWAYCGKRDSPIFVDTKIGTVPRKGSAIMLAMYLAVVGWWIVLQPLCWDMNIEPMCWVGALGGLFLLIAMVHAPQNEMAAPFYILGVGLVLVALVPLSFADYQIEYYYHSHPEKIDLIIYTGIGLIVMGLVGVLGLAYWAQKRLERQIGTPVSYSSQVVSLIIPGIIIVSMGFFGIWHGVTTVPHTSSHYYYMDSYLKWSYPILVPTGIINILMVGFALWLMRMGMKEDRGMIFALGVLYFLLWAVMRYIDLFGGAGGMLGAALLFLICGVVLFVVARVWQHRKEISHV